MYLYPVTIRGGYEFYACIVITTSKSKAKKMAYEHYSDRISNINSIAVHSGYLVNRKREKLISLGGYSE